MEREHEMDFGEADRRYAELKRQHDTATVSDEEFEEQLEQLMVQDDEGRWWARSLDTGEWHYYDGAAWVQGTAFSIVLPAASMGPRWPRMRAACEVGRRPARALLQQRYPEVLTDLTDQVVGYLGVSGNRGSCARRGVAVDAVICPSAAQLAAMAFQVPQELATLQTSSGSRITSFPAASRSASSRRTSSKSVTASRIISRASSSVLPWLCAPGPRVSPVRTRPTSRRPYARKLP